MSPVISTALMLKAHDIIQVCWLQEYRHSSFILPILYFSISAPVLKIFHCSVCVEIIICINWRARLVKPSLTKSSVVYGSGYHILVAERSLTTSRGRDWRLNDGRVGTTAAASATAAG